MLGAMEARTSPRPSLRRGVPPAVCLLLLCLGLMLAPGPASARQAAPHALPGLPGVCRAILSKVQSYIESNLQSSLVGMRGGICSWLELNGCQQYKVVFTPVYKIAFRTVYVNGFVCCPGYSRIGNTCVPARPAAVPPGSGATVPHGPPDNARPGVTGPTPPPASDNDKQDGHSALPAFTGLYMTAGPVAAPPSSSPLLPTAGEPSPERTPRTNDDPSPGPRDQLLLILLILVVVVALCAVASFATHFAKLWRRGQPTCCFGVLAMPRIRTGRDSTDESRKMTCILGTISSDCSAESVRSGLSDLSRRSGSDRSALSGLSASSEVTFIDDSDSGIVKHVVYERCWKDTASLLSYASSSGASQGSGSKVSALLSRKCTPLLTIPLTPLAKKRRPSPPLPVRPDERVYDTTPHSPPLHLPLPLNHPKLSSSPTRQPSPGPYSYTSLNKKDLHQLSSKTTDKEPTDRSELVAGPARITHKDIVLKPPVSPVYVNVKRETAKLRPIYVTLEPDTESVATATECCEEDEDPWKVMTPSPSSSPGRSVGYCALSNQVLPHRRSGNGYDKLERNRQNLPALVPESFPAPEYAVPSVAAPTGGPPVEADAETETKLSRASPDLRRSGTMPSITFEYLRLVEKVQAENDSKQQEEERYISAPRHNYKEMVFIDAIRKLHVKAPNSKHNSVG